MIGIGTNMLLEYSFFFLQNEITMGSPNILLSETSIQEVSDLKTRSQDFGSVRTLSVFIIIYSVILNSNVTAVAKSSSKGKRPIVSLLGNLSSLLYRSTLLSLQ